MNELESQLRLWAPRPPSAKLSRRLFAHHPEPVTAAGPSPVTAAQSPAFRISWLAPATAALLLMCVLFNEHNSATLGGSPSSGPLVALILSNQSAAAWLPGSFTHEQNSVPANTFEWTNGSGSTSSIHSLSGPRGKMNQ